MNPFKTNKRLKADLQVAQAEADSLSARLSEFQTQVEVAGEALQLKDLEFVSFLHELQEAIGGEFTTRESALDCIRRIRAKGDLMQTIFDVIDGAFEPDAELLRRVACALGTSQLDVGSVLAQANGLGSVQAKNIELFRQLRTAQVRVAELEEEVYDLNGSERVEMGDENGEVETDLDGIPMPGNPIIVGTDKDGRHITDQDT